MHLLVRERPNPDVELYDTLRDPRELHDLSPAAAPAAQAADPAGVRLGYLMSRMRALHGRERGGAGSKPAPLPGDLAARLRALGYLR
jgi:hypothetical protein